MILVTSGWILFAMPKSINFSEAFTMTKFAGFKSLWTIPTQKRYLQLLDIPDHFPHHFASWWHKIRWIYNHVCGWFGQLLACSSSRTSSPADSPLCGFATMCSDPSFHTPSACIYSCWLFHCNYIENDHAISYKTNHFTLSYELYHPLYVQNKMATF